MNNEITVIKSKSTVIETAVKGPLTLNERLQFCQRKINRMEVAMDNLLMGILYNLPDNAMNEPEDKLSLKVCRGGKIRFTNCTYIFKYNGKRYFVCEYKESPISTKTYIEEEFLVWKENKHLRTPENKQITLL